ncbi:cytochrome P450 family protein [Streptomyces sp. NBC_00690]|uniref:cytochrome P450 family protein n=1 Tax=Streptomyces sp. NBC_00690 TaxID=2975808 RepID=UPI002E29193C|nr:P450-derived glycosyltransferase activator [Streptomyces sp. NBC_00690]
MISTKTDSELGSLLMSLRGMQWIYGIKDDPYALLLRAESDDPHDLGRHARAHGEVMWSMADAWVTAKYDTAAELLRDPRFGVRYPVAAEGNDGEPTYEWQLPALHRVLPLDEVYLAQERSQYRELSTLARATVGTGFAAEVAERCKEALGRQDGAFDFMTEVAHPVAASAVAALLGVSPAERERFVALCVDTAPALDATVCPPRTPTARALITAVDQVGELLDAAGNGAGATARGVAGLFAVAGVQMAANTAARTVALLLDHAESWDRVREESDCAADAVQEALRHSPPMRMQKLYAYEDVELGGQPIEAGHDVVVLVEAAQRDPDAYPDPDRFDLDRPAGAPLLAFTDDLFTGPLEPLVRPLATAVVASAVAQLPELRRAGPELRRLRSPVTGGVLHLPVSTG